MYDYDDIILDELYGSEDDDDEITTPEDDLRDRGMSLRDFM